MEVRLADKNARRCPECSAAIVPNEPERRPIVGIAYTIGAAIVVALCIAGTLSSLPNPDSGDPVTVNWWFTPGLLLAWVLARQAWKEFGL